MALRGFITLDPVALASFCESTQSNTLMLLLSDTGALLVLILFVLFWSSVFLSTGPLSEPADDQ